MKKIRKQFIPDPQRWQATHKNKTVSLSDRMYSMALAIESVVQRNGTRVLDREFLDTLTGGTINAYIARGYLKGTTATTVLWTKAGSAAVANHSKAEFHRQPSGRFSRWLNLATYDSIPAERKGAA